MTNKMKLIVFLIVLIVERLQCRSANDFLKDVFSIEDDPKEQKCSTMQCQTAGKFIETVLILNTHYDIFIVSLY